MRGRAVTAMAAWCLTGFAAAFATGASVDLRTAYQELLTMRGALAGRLQERLDKTRPQVLDLRVERGADTHDLCLLLKQSEGKWAGTQAWVPAWDQLTAMEWRK